MGYSELQRRADIVARHRENRGRMASCSVTVVTTGTGVVEFEDPIDFGMIFVEEPRVHYGSMVDSDDLRNAASLTDADDLPLPVLSGSVVSWDIDDNGHYAGAWVAVHIYSLSLIPDMSVTHHFNFAGIGLKQFPVGPTA
jgi:hypothetical protein